MESGFGYENIAAKTNVGNIASFDAVTDRPGSRACDAGSFVNLEGRPNIFVNLRSHIFTLTQHVMLL